MRTRSALTSTAPSRPSRGGVHATPALVGGDARPAVVTTRSRASSVQRSGVRSSLNDALASSKPRRRPSWTTPGDRAWIVPSAPTGRPSSQVLHTVAETTPESRIGTGCPAPESCIGTGCPALEGRIVSACPAPRGSRATSTSWAATYAVPDHDRVGGPSAGSIAKSIRADSWGSNEPEMRYRPPACPRRSVTPSSGTGRAPRRSSTHRMRDATSEMLAGRGAHRARPPPSCAASGASPTRAPSAPMANVPSERRTTANDAPVTVISRGRKAPERRRSSGSIENSSRPSRIDASGGSAGCVGFAEPAGSPSAVPPSAVPPSAGSPSGVSRPASRTSSIRKTGDQPRQCASIAPSSISRSVMRLSQPSIAGR